jgi:predicted NodU family carbamoyl transferase
MSFPLGTEGHQSGDDGAVLPIYSIRRVNSKLTCIRAGDHRPMNVLSYNPGHDGAIAFLQNSYLRMCNEAEKNSNYRHSAVSCPDVFNALGEMAEIPDVLCVGGWWPRDHYDFLHGSDVHVGYRGIEKRDIITSRRRLLGKEIHYFSSSHERSHLLCAFGMSNLPEGTPCYALIWEGSIGAFYEIDEKLKITMLGDVLHQAGNRYGLLYGLADPTFPKNGPYPRTSDAGKLMALASFSTRTVPSDKEKKLLSFLLDGPYKELSAYDELEDAPHLNVGVEDPEFRNFAGIYSDAIFGLFYKFAKANLREKRPLVIAGGCGLNCDWNSKWKDSGLFTDVFIPPVANDSGSAIGTAIDAQFHFTGISKINWDVYSGLDFVADAFDSSPYDCYETDYELLADLLANDVILGWASGRYEIGPRALGNRSILAAPFQKATTTRLNKIKQREQFRPIAPVCLEEDAAVWFGCNRPSPFMLYTYVAKTDALAAVTHVNGTARLQTVTEQTNQRLYKLLSAFKARTGYGVLCNTSLNFNGKGFINNVKDLSTYAVEHGLDGFVINGRAYLLKNSNAYRAFLATQGTFIKLNGD